VRYQAVLFDLFDTLVLFDRTRLPLVQLNGRAIHSSAGILHALFQPHVPRVDLAAFLDAVLWSWQEAERLRAIDHREVPAPERFRMLFRHLGIAPDAVPPAALEALLDAHRRALVAATHFPEHHGPLLRRLADHYRLGVVSNFDYAPTARSILDATGVGPLLAAVVVSDEVGWRKPKPVIFEEALRQVGVGPRDALFVGDRADIDVLGAQGAGIHAVWVNRDGSSLPPGVRAPEFEIRDLAELAAIVGR
jgi:FMN phosphatase YigB (HAD superfamily)